ncbi:MFS transporter [Paeniglutamicibacter antarcticus]|uniref:MFS transporter n=1 Tax=Arthrobacter terrae TaxID=2935737 RepID=A0A931G404_9MICC|nr:MFS transporter [Arthrobacter terrae]MBG0737875.1 MFS transporter [Arthrobacter terrae]
MTIPSASNALSSARWRRLVPIAFITYSFAYLDRSNYSIGAAGGLQDALGITSGQTGLLGGLFFIGYFIFQVPAARFAERRSVKTLMFWSLILWGILAALQGVVPWFWALLVIRFLLGVVEAAVLPAMLVFLAHWFSASERGRTNTFLILGNPVTLLWMSVVSGYIIAATSYQWMFIIEGLPAIAWAFIFRAVTADRPADADWLDEAERKSIEKKLAEEQAALPEPLGLRQVLTSRNVIILAIQYALWSVGVYGFVFWLPTIIESASQQGIGLTGLLSAIPYAAAIVLMIIASFFSDRLGHRQRFVWPFLLVATVAFFASYLIGPGNFVLSFVLLIVAGAAMYAPYGPYFAFIPEFLPADSAASAIGAINAFGALGGFAGAYVVGLLGGGTKSGAAFVFMAACLLASAVLIFFVKQPQAPARDTAGGSTSGRPAPTR